MENSTWEHCYFSGGLPYLLILCVSLGFISRELVYSIGMTHGALFVVYLLTLCCIVSGMNAVDGLSKVRDSRVLSIQSHVVHGYAGNKCSVFPLQVCAQASINVSIFE